MIPLNLACHRTDKHRSPEARGSIAEELENRGIPPSAVRLLIGDSDEGRMTPYC